MMRVPKWQQVGASVGLAVLVAACSGGATTPPATSKAPSAAPAGGSVGSAQSGGGAGSPPALERAKIVYTTIAAVQAPFWIAYEAGYFREQGLDVPELIRIEPGATLLAALTNNEVEFVAAGGPSLVLGTLQGLDTLVFGSTLNWLESIVMARPEIRTPQDLRGQTIAVSRLKAISDVAARLGVERHGLRPDVDVFTRGTGGNAESLAAMEGGTVAAASLSVPALFEARKRGYHDLIDVTAMRISFANGALGATKATLDRRQDVAERVLKATAQATSRFKTDHEYTSQVIAKYTRIDDPEATRGTIETYSPIMTVDPYPDPAAIQAVLDVEEHPDARTLPANRFIDYRAAEAARRGGFMDRLPKD